MYVHNWCIRVLICCSHVLLSVQTYGEPVFRTLHFPNTFQTRCGNQVVRNGQYDNAILNTPLSSF